MSYLVRPLCLLFPLLLTACSSTKNTLKIASLDELKIQEAADEADYSRPPSELQIVVGKDAVWKGPYLIISGKLINPTDRPIHYYGHDYPVPLNLKLSEDAPVSNRRDVASVSSSKPQAIRVTVPPRSSVNIEGGMDLSNYDYQGEPEVVVNWEFKFWSGDRPSGKFTAKLPARKEDTVARRKSYVKKRPKFLISQAN